MFIVGPVSVQCTDYMAIILLKSAITNQHQSNVLLVPGTIFFFQHIFTIVKFHYDMITDHRCDIRNQDVYVL